MGGFSGRLMSSASDQKLFCEICSAFNCSFDEFVGEKVVSPSYSSAILAPPPPLQYFKGTAPPASDANLIPISFFFFFGLFFLPLEIFSLFLFQGVEILFRELKFYSRELKFYIEVSWGSPKFFSCSFLWGCRGWQAARTWVLVSPEMVGFPAPIR